MEHFTESETRAVAHAEMSKWGLIDLGWTFGIDNTVRRLGQCSTRKRKLSVSGHHVTHDSKEQVVDTIRHEIAHALHYEQYVSAGIREEYFARRWKNGRYIRKVPPHGAAWKRIALKVGVGNPTASSPSNIQKNVVHNWRIVMVRDGTVVDMEHGFQRFPKHMSKRYMNGRKRETLGNLFLIKGAEWKAYAEGRLSVARLSFYQDLSHTPASSGITGLII